MPDRQPDPDQETARRLFVRLRRGATRPARADLTRALRDVPGLTLLPGGGRDGVGVLAAGAALDAVRDLLPMDLYEITDPPPPAPAPPPRVRRPRRRYGPARPPSG